jgi:GrpB-like predicted nucleotidyltransferase (UPF0157 family)/RimJ/RimL family protein N-acetyltransferase
VDVRRDAIVIVPYDPGWPAAFRAQRDRIDQVLRPLLLHRIEHIGSTAVPGMAAKPIVDMLAVVADVDAVAPVEAPLAELGWVPAPEPGDGERRVRSFCTPGVEHRTHHLHVVERDAIGWRGTLAFRDHLRAHPGLAGAYAALKRELADRHGDDPNHREPYRAGKAAFVEELTAVAMARSTVAVLRDATLADARSIADLHAQSWRATYRGLVPQGYLDSLSGDDRLEKWLSWLATGPPANQAVVVVQRGQIRGFATICATEGVPPVLGAIYVDVEHWGRGYGGALLAAAEERARNAGHTEMTLWVHPRNEHARRFYERAGWTDDGLERTATAWGVELPERRYRRRL